MLNRSKWVLAVTFLLRKVESSCAFTSDCNRDYDQHDHHYPPPSNYEPIHQGFFGAADEEEGELPPFVLPVDVGVKVESSPTQDPARVSRSGLCIVLEEDNLADMEDIFVSEEDEGAIEFEFEIPPAFTSPPRTPSPTMPRVPTFQARKPAPFCEFVSEDDDTAFSFPSVSLVSGKAASPSSPGDPPPNGAQAL